MGLLIDGIQLEKGKKATAFEAPAVEAGEAKEFFFPSGKEVHGIGITPDKAMQQKMEPFATEIVSSLEKITVDQGYRGGINYGKNDIRH